MNTEKKMVCLPNFMIRDDDVTPKGELVYLYLVIRAGKDKKIKLSRKEIGEDMGIGSRSVSRYIRQLRKADLIEIEITPYENIYKIKKDETKIKYLDK